jgi:HNH endonuclease
MPKKHPYTCPRCEYFTSKKTDMYKHLYNVKKPCPALKINIELTDDIKKYILDNRIYNTSQSLQNNSTKPIKQTITHTLKIKCWDTHIGVDIGKTKCLCCNHNDITQHHFHCGHVVAEANGGTIHIDNLRPICSACNNSMRTRNMDEFIAHQGFSQES